MLIRYNFLFNRNVTTGIFFILFLGGEILVMILLILYCNFYIFTKILKTNPSELNNENVYMKYFNSWCHVRQLFVQLRLTNHNLQTFGFNVSSLLSLGAGINPLFGCVWYYKPISNAKSPVDVATAGVSCM